MKKNGKAKRLPKKVSKKTSNRKAKGKGKSPGVPRNVKSNQRLSREEKEILKEFERLIKEDESQRRREAKQKPVRAIKKRGEPVFTVPLPRKKDFAAKIRAIQNADLSAVDREIKRRRIEPLYAAVILKIKTPKESGYYFNSVLTPNTMVVDATNLRVFGAETLSDYQDKAFDKLLSSNAPMSDIYNVISITFRLLFPR